MASNPVEMTNLKSVTLEYGFSLFRNVQTGSDLSLSLPFNGYRDYFSEKSGRSTRLISHFNIIPSIRMNAALPCGFIDCGQASVSF